MKKWLAGLGILGLSVLTLAACGNKSDSKASGEKQTITVATDSDTAPFTFKKGDDFKGYDIDLVKAIFKDSDKYEVKFVTTPFDSILTGLDVIRLQLMTLTTMKNVLRNMVSQIRFHVLTMPSLVLRVPSLPA